MGVAIRYIKDRYEGQELVNDVFMKAFKNLEQFAFRSEVEAENYRAFQGWLARITVTLAIDRLRVKKRSLYIEDLGEDVSIVQAEASTDLHVEDILKLLNQLPEIQRLVFNMFEIEGFSHNEIAQSLMIPSSTSRAYLTRAKNKLRELYTKTLIHSYG